MRQLNYSITSATLLRRFFIVMSYGWGWLLSSERPDKGVRSHPATYWVMYAGSMLYQQLEGQDMPV